MCCSSLLMENHKYVLVWLVHVELFPSVFFQQNRIRDQLFVGVDVSHLVLGVCDSLLQIGDFAIQIPVGLEIMVGDEEKVDQKHGERHNIQYCEELEAAAGFRFVGVHSLAGVVDGAGLPDDGDFDLARIRHFVLNLFGQVE